GIVLAQLEIPIETVEHLASLCGEDNVPLMLDPAPAHALPNSMFRCVHWLTPNETEAAFFASPFTEGKRESGPTDIACALLRLGVENVVLKMGSRGVYLVSAKDGSHMLPAFPV